MQIVTSPSYDQSQIDAGKILWDQIAASAKSGDTVILTSAENAQLWAYNDSLHRAAMPEFNPALTEYGPDYGCTPQSKLGIIIQINDPPPPA